MQPRKDGVLITGGSGFLGRALVERLLPTDHGEGAPERICIYSRSESRQAEMRSEFCNDGRLRWFIGDVRDRERLERAMESVEYVIHAAALKRIEVGQYNPDEMVKTNVMGTINVIEAARRAGVRKVLLVSSDKAYQPVSPYGQSKAMAESMILNANDPQYGPRFAVVRYGNVAGSTGSVIPTWRAALAQRRPLMVTDPDCTRFWMSRAEAANLVADTLNSMRGGERAIPKLPAFRLADLMLAMNIDQVTEVKYSGLPAHEKKHESMDDGNCSETARRLTVEELKSLLTEV